MRSKSEAKCTVFESTRPAGGVMIAEGAYIGAGAMVREGLSVGAWSLLGMGSVLVDALPAGEVWAGVPARRIRKASVPDDLVRTI